MEKSSAKAKLAIMKELPHTFFEDSRVRVVFLLYYKGDGHYGVANGRLFEPFLLI